MTKHYALDAFITNENGLTLYSNTPGGLANCRVEADEMSEFQEGDFAWNWNGMVHRVGGPAEYFDGVERHWLFDVEFDTIAVYDSECLNKTLPDWAEYDAYVKALNSATN